MILSFFIKGGNLREFTDEESNFSALLHKAMELQGVDRETVHFLVSLLMRVRKEHSQKKCIGIMNQTNQ